jgi:hypothetical protein
METERMKRLLSVAAAIAVVAGSLGCAPEVGSEAWCKKMDAKPKGDWTVNEAGDYAKHCIIRTKK